MNSAVKKRKSAFPSRMLQTGIFFLVFFSIYAVDFVFLPTFTQRLIAYGFLIVFFLIVVIRNPRWANDQSFNKILFLIFSILLYSFFSSALTGFVDNSQIIGSLVLIVQVGVASFGIAWLLLRNEFEIHDVIRLVVVVIAVQAILIAIQFSVAPFRNWVAENVPILGNFDVDPIHRGRGLYHSPSATLAVVQSIGLFFCIYLLYVGPHRSRKLTYAKPLELAAAVALLISIMLTGRTGFMVLPFVLLYLVVSSIAGALGMSVGLTNAILKRLADKGLLMVRRINQHNVHYLVTPDGIDQITRRSYRYLRRTIGHVVRYKEHLRDWCHQQKLQGTTALILLGESDLTFILEWCAHKEGLAFRHIPGDPSDNRHPAATQTPPGTVTILAESVLTPTWKR